MRALEDDKSTSSRGTRTPCQEVGVQNLVRRQCTQKPPKPKKSERAPKMSSRARPVRQKVADLAERMAQRIAQSAFSNL